MTENLCHRVYSYYEQRGQPGWAHAINLGISLAMRHPEWAATLIADMANDRWEDVAADADVFPLLFPVVRLQEVEK